MSIDTKRAEILYRVKALRASDAKPPDDARLDRQLAGLAVTLPTGWLTSAMLASGATFVGFLYNVGFSAYVYTDANSKWLYAGKSTTDGAVRFNIYQDSVGNLVLMATLGGTAWYFNWRTSTGACKLYDSYDKMIAKDWAGTVFKMLNPSNSEFFGTWSRTDNELYNRTIVNYQEFQFEFFDQSAFSEDDHLIFAAYMKEYASQS